MKKINEELLKKYLDNEMIFEFKDAKEFMDFVIYDCPDIPNEYKKDMDSVKEYFAEFLFEYKGKFYEVGYSEALDVYEEVE